LPRQFVQQVKLDSVELDLVANFSAIGWCSGSHVFHGLDRVRVEIAASQLGAADVPAAKHRCFGAVVELLSLAAPCRVMLRHVDVLEPNRLVCAFDAHDGKITVSDAEGAEIDLTDLKGFHGSAEGKLLGDEELNFLHLFGDFALGFAAFGEVTTSEAMGVFGLGSGEALLGFFKLLEDGFHLRQEVRAGWLGRMMARFRWVCNPFSIGFVF